MKFAMVYYNNLTFGNSLVCIAIFCVREFCSFFVEIVLKNLFAANTQLRYLLSTNATVII